MKLAKSRAGNKPDAQSRPSLSWNVGCVPKMLHKDLTHKPLEVGQEADKLCNQCLLCGGFQPRASLKSSPWIVKLQLYTHVTCSEDDALHICIQPSQHA